MKTTEKTTIAVIERAVNKNRGTIPLIILKCKFTEHQCVNTLSIKYTVRYSENLHKRYVCVYSVRIAFIAYAHSRSTNS